MGRNKIELNQKQNGQFKKTGKKENGTKNKICRVNKGSRKKIGTKEKGVRGQKRENTGKRKNENGLDKKNQR